MGDARINWRMHRMAKDQGTAETSSALIPDLDPETRRVAGRLAWVGVLGLAPLLATQVAVLPASTRLVVVAATLACCAAVVGALWMVRIGGPWRPVVVAAIVVLDISAILTGALAPIGLDAAVAMPFVGGMILVVVLRDPWLRVGLAGGWLAGVVGCWLSRSTPGLSAVPNATPIWLATAFTAMATGLAYVALYWAAGRWRAVAVEARATAERERVALEAHRQSSERARAIMEFSPLPILAFDSDAQIYAWNPAAERDLGWAADDVVGFSIGMLVPAAMREAVLARARQTIATGEIPTRRVADFVRKDGSGVRAEVYGAIEFDADGKPMGVVVQFLDVSEREAATERLAEARRLEAVGQLAGGIAHDFNNSLTAIAGFASLIASGTTTTPTEDARTILRAAEHSALLTRQLLAFSRRAPLQPQLVDLCEFVAAAEPLVRSLVGETIALRLDGCRTGALVEVDPVTLEQAVLNLVTNARDAMPRGGELTISVGTYPACWSGDAPEPEAHCAIVVSDTGTGIPAEDMPRIFEPFFTTKPVGEGTGLGLPMVHGFVTASRGHVVVTSPPGQGATVELHFPAASGTPARAPERTQAVGGGESVLFVEDDPGVAAFGLACLRRLGYDVTPAMNGSEAVSLAASRATPFDLLLTDVVIPGMSGPELAAKIHRHHPSTAILFASGYGTDRVSQVVLEPPDPLLEKPYSLDQLALKVRQALDLRARDGNGSDGPA